MVENNAILHQNRQITVSGPNGPVAKCKGSLKEFYSSVLPPRIPILVHSAHCFPRPCYTPIFTPRGGTSMLGGRRGLAPKFASEVRVRAPNFASKNNGDKYPKICPLNFRYNPKCPQSCDSFPNFAPCGNRTSQIFPLI